MSAGDAWLRAVLRGDPIQEQPDEPPAAPSFNGGPRITAQPEPDPSSIGNAALRSALARKIAHDSVN